jgi:hypothetical protein
MRILKFFIYNKSGSVLVFAIIFLGILSMTTLSFAGLAISQTKLGEILISKEYSLQIAESGLSYARWRLAHNATDYTEETKTLSDPEGGVIGSFKVSFTPPSAGSPAKILSHGWYKTNTGLERILEAQYGRKAFTFYAFLFDKPVWFGGSNVDGRVHSNTGIRMDATGNSSVTAAQATYSCPALHACSGTKPCVWGSGGNQSLWKFPVSNIDFNGVTTDLGTLHTLAETGTGLFLPHNLSPKGFDLNFLADGTVQVYKVNSLDPPVKSLYFDGSNSVIRNRSIDIATETLLQTYTLQPNDLIFSERDMWIRGVVNGRVTAIAAFLPENAGNNRDIIISQNLTYAAYDATVVLGLIAQRDVMLSLKVPIAMRIDGVLMAQKGFISRDCYDVLCTNISNSTVDPWRVRNSITTYGSMISKEFSDAEFRWVNGSNATISGFDTNNNSYDPSLTYNPPPYFPLMGDSDFFFWQEKGKNE